jgi:hypothetical protein
MTIAINIGKNGLDRLLIFARKLTNEQLGSFFVSSAGALLALTGSAYLVQFFSDIQSLDVIDPVFNISFRWLIFVIGILHLGTAVSCLFTTRKIFSLWLIVWVAMQFMIYRIGLWQMGWPRPYALVSIFTEGLSVSAAIGDAFVMASILYLLGGSAWVLLKMRQDQLARDFLKLSCPACYVHIRFAVKNLGLTISCPKCNATVILRKPDESLKISCYFCKGHIEFPLHAIGAKMACPHCKMDITLNDATLNDHSIKTY